jgi:hypothetical protein
MLKHTFPLALRMLPLAGALFLMAADGDACIIIDNDNNDDDDDECVDLDEACPNLECAAGNVVVDGCEICECADTCEPGPAPECANARLTDDCEWVCGGDECFSDRDCGGGFICAFFDSADDDGADDAARPAPGGVCVPVDPPQGCRSDDECGRGFFCDFSGQGGGNDGAPEAPPDDDRADPIPPPPEGVCRQNDVCFDDSDCARGQRCEFFGGGTGNGLVAPGGTCVDNEFPVSECESDRDCNGGTCVIECQSDPSCPECDVCLFIGVCLETTCFSDSDCHSDQFCDVSGQGGGAAPPCRDEDGDNRCDDALIAVEGVCRDLNTETGCFSDDECERGQFCDFGGQAEPEPCDPNSSDCADRLIAPQGVCRDLTNPEGCFSDDDCGRGQICALTDGCVCDTSCQDDGQGGCLPCECPNIPGVCIDVGGNDECFADEDCARGQRCELSGGGCEGGPICETGPDGEEVCFGCDPFIIGICVDDTIGNSCFSDDDCRDDETCVIEGQDDPADCFAPDCATRPAPGGGTCQPRETDVCALVRCGNGATCEVDDRGNAICVPENGGCYGDQDCADGLSCNAGIDVCDSPPECDGDLNCPAVCYGYCVEPTRE